jgi:hypothetical protein
MTIDVGMGAARPLWSRPPLHKRLNFGFSHLVSFRKLAVHDVRESDASYLLGGLPDAPRWPHRVVRPRGKPSSGPTRPEPIHKDATVQHRKRTVQLVHARFVGRGRVGSRSRSDGPSVCRGPRLSRAPRYVTSRRPNWYAVPYVGPATTRNDSCATGPVRVVAPMSSVISTTLFGSAPLSPEALDVDVVAQSVTRLPMTTPVSSAPPVPRVLERRPR